MGRALMLGEAIIIIKELFDTTSDFFENLVPDNFYKVMDKLAFLNSKILAIGSNGEMLDGTRKIAEAIMNLSNIVIWGIFLFYGFKSLFSYFLSKKVDVPWKFFVRMIVFGVLANASFFICYTGVFFSENCTEYVRSYVGEGKISFSCLSDYIVEENIEVSNDEGEVYTFDALFSIFIYFSTFFLSVCLGVRYLLIKGLILFSPVFFILGGFRGSEKIFFCWCKKICFLIFLQIFFCVVLGIVNLCDFDSELFSGILISAMLFLISKNILGFLKLSY